MKRLLATCLFFLPGSAFAQMQPPPPTMAELAAGTESKSPFKGANIILIHTPDSAAVALKKMARTLVLADIEPDKLDVEIGYLTTKGKPVGQISPAVYQYRVVASAEPGGTLLTITGTYTVKTSLTNSITSTMFWKEGNMTQGKQCFALVEKAALLYSPSRLGYKMNIPRNTIQQR